MRGYLGNFELMVLLAVMRLDREGAYGVPIAREIEDTSGRTVALASVYASLERLEERGLVTSSLGDPTPERGGRARRHLTITGKGIREVQEARQALTKLWNRLPHLKDKPA